MPLKEACPSAPAERNPAHGAVAALLDTLSGERLQVALKISGAQKHASNCSVNLDSQRALGT